MRLPLNDPRMEVRKVRLLCELKLSALGGMESLPMPRALRKVNSVVEWVK